MDDVRPWRRWDHRYLWHPVHPDARLARRGAAGHRARRGQLPDRHARAAATSTASRRCGATSTATARRELDAALKAQCDRIAHIDDARAQQRSRHVLAKRLVEITPRSLTRVFYSDAGATAVEIALKLALQYWQLRGEEQRTRFVSLGRGLPRRHPGRRRRRLQRHLPPFLPPGAAPVATDPTRRTTTAGAKARTRGRALALRHRRRRDASSTPPAATCAALIVEPLMQGAAGMWAQPLGYLPALRDLARTLRHPADLRRGRHRLRPHRGDVRRRTRAASSPTSSASAKASPAAICRSPRPWRPRRSSPPFLAPLRGVFEAFFHGHTYTGNPLACAVARRQPRHASHAENVVDRVRQRGARRCATCSTDHVRPLAASATSASGA